MLRIVSVGAVVAGWMLIAPLSAVAQTAPAAKPADITQAVRCQTLVVQFNDRFAASKEPDEVKTAARGQLTAGNKACNEKDYGAGIEQIRLALGAIKVKPLH